MRGNILINKRFSIFFLLMFAFSGSYATQAQQFYPLDTPKVIATPEQAIERVRASILSYSVESSMDRDDYSTQAIKQLAHDLLSLHVITPPGDEDVKDNWIVQPGKDKHDLYLVNRANGSVTLAVKLLALNSKTGFSDLNSVQSNRIPRQETREDREANGFGINRYLVQKHGDSYWLTVTFNPIIHGSKHGYMIFIELENGSSGSGDKEDNLMIGRLYHIQNLVSATFVITKEELKACPNIFVDTIGNNAGTTPGIFTINKLPEVDPYYWSNSSDDKTP